MGIVNCRYTLILDGKTDAGRQAGLRLVSWEARPASMSAAEFDWAAGRLVHAQADGRAEGEDRPHPRQGVEEGRGGAGEVDRRVRGPEPEPRRAPPRCTAT